MKKNIFLYLLAFMSLAANAQDPVKVGEYYYTVEDNHNTAILVANPQGGGYSGDVVINATIDYGGKTYRVSDIGYRAFCGTDILKVTINGQLDDKGRGLRINPHAFSYCKSLASVTIGDGVDYIQNFAFYACDNLANVVVGDDVTWIYEQAFQNCHSLTSVILGKKVNSIDASAFLGCEELKDVYCLGSALPTYLKGSRPIFDYDHIRDATLHALASATFVNGDPWIKFGKLETMASTTLEKCATPTITYENGTVSFACETEGVEFNSKVEYVQKSFNSASAFPAPSTFLVKVVAFKNGYLPSDVVAKEFDLPSYVGVKNEGNYEQGDVNKDGKVNVADQVVLTNVIE